MVGYFQLSGWLSLLVRDTVNECYVLGIRASFLVFFSI